MYDIASSAPEVTEIEPGKAVARLEALQVSLPHGIRTNPLDSFVAANEPIRRKKDEDTISKARLSKRT
jgi:hypothetical protein